MEDDLKCKDDLQSVQNVTYEFLGESKGKLRGNLECGSAQPSLLNSYFVNWFIMPYSFNLNTG